MNFIPKNKVTWLKRERGLHFSGRGIAYSPGAYEGTHSYLPAMDAFSIELFFRPLKDHTCSVAPLLSFVDEGESPMLMIGQWRSHVIILAKGREIDSGNILTIGKRALVTITTGQQGTTLYIDGRAVRLYPGFSLAGPQGIPLRIVLGNSPTGKAHWTGDILGLAVYDRTLKADETYLDHRAWASGNPKALLENRGIVSLYVFSEGNGHSVADLTGKRRDILVPAAFRILKEERLIPIWKDFRLNRSYITDIAVNIAGFVPFGFILAFLLHSLRKPSRQGMYLTALFASGTVSLTIELLQVYLPSRSSQMSDLIFNILGTILGVALFR
ncbi:MAG: hypothetical protein GXP63_03340, partial [DPANN group archaeon]|nr:hypothetical protein [DPANN group archaeon]